MDAATNSAGDANAVDIGPLAAVEGKWAALADLKRLTLKSGGAYFSETVLAVLTDAMGATTRRTGDGRPVVDAAAFLFAALGGVPEGALANKGAHEGTANAFLALWLQEHGLAPSADGPVEKSAGGEGESATVVAPELTAALAEAARLVQQTHMSQKRVDIRHVLVALLPAEPGRKALARLGLVQGAFTPFFAELGEALIGHVVGQLHRERKGAWEDCRRLFRNVAPPGAGAPRLTHTDYLADSAQALPEAGRDPLGFVEDARALAELVCLEAAEPPLAIGLFGHWGSGKTTMMRLLEREIDATAVEARAAADEAPLPFVRNVVHIWFNAWTYADSSNLWASLATELFRQLGAGGHRHRGEAIKAGYMSELEQALAGQRANAAALQFEHDELRRQLDERRDELRRIETEKSEAAAGKITDRVERIVREFLVHDPKLRDSLAELGIDADKVTAARIAGLLKEFRSFLGHTKGVWQALSVGDRRRVHWAHLALGLLAVPVVFAITTVAQNAEAGSILATLSAFAVLALKYANIVHRAIDPLRAEQAKIDAGLARRTAEVKAEVAGLNSRVEAKKAELARTEAAPETLEQAVAAGRRSLLAYFLRRRASAEEWRQHLGVIALVQEALEELSVLFKAQREDYERRREAGTLLSDEAPPIDRIVLYIDDLDRCQHEQVVEVLQAVHLLLAFPLFVVVVGVDARWLSHSLRQVYERQLRDDGDEAAGPEKATVSDYLEKIFQIPFWLRELDDPDGIAYQRLVNDLVGVEHDTVEPWSGAAAPAAAEPAPEPGGQSEQPGAKGQIEPIEVEMPDEPESVAETWARVELTEAELRLMRALGPIAGKSPRAVKRFVNLYRLIRVRQKGTDQVRFLYGSGDEPPLFPVVMLWLAFEVGAPVGKVDQLLKAMKGESRERQMRDVVYDVFDVEDVGIVLSTESAAEAAGGRTLRVHHLMQAAELAARYSFRQGIETTA